MLLRPKPIITPALEAPWVREPMLRPVYTDRLLVSALYDEYRETFAMRKLILDAEPDPKRRQETLTEFQLTRSMVIFGLTLFKDRPGLRYDWLRKAKRPRMTVGMLLRLDSDDWAWVDWECFHASRQLGLRVDQSWVVRQVLLLAHERMRWYREDPQQWAQHPVLSKAWAHKKLVRIAA